MIGQIVGGVGLALGAIAVGTAAGVGIGAASTPPCPANPTVSQSIQCDKRLNMVMTGAAAGEVATLGVMFAGAVLAVVSSRRRVLGISAAVTAAATAFAASRAAVT